MSDSEKKTYEFRVTMTCEGCSNAIERVLNRYLEKGVDKIMTDVSNNRVVITSSLAAEDLVRIIEKTGKKVHSVKPK